MIIKQHLNSNILNSFNIFSQSRSRSLDSGLDAETITMEMGSAKAQG